MYVTFNLVKYIALKKRATNGFDSFEAFFFQPTMWQLKRLLMCNFSVTILLMIYMTYLNNTHE